MELELQERDEEEKKQREILKNKYTNMKGFLSKRGCHDNGVFKLT